MKILVVGGGGREHALVWKLSQSPLVEQIFTAPGNAGTAQLGRNLDIDAEDIDGLLAAAQKEQFDLAVVGPEAPLAAGIVDRFQEAGFKVFGPSKKAARIEASKVYARQIMDKYDIPCAKGEVFASYDKAIDYVKKQTPPLVVKADGLAAGKGVTVAQTQDVAIKALENIMRDRAFGEAGDRVIIEECLEGKEMSFLAFSDGEVISPMLSACDYKRVFDGGRGPNTGGMGAYCPPSFHSPFLTEQIMDMVIKPVIKGLAKEGTPYCGVLYAGLMLTADGPKVLEFNARFGDPETQVILPLLGSDLADILLAVIDRRLIEVDIDWKGDSCVGVVMASGGYPGFYEKGKLISGLNSVDQDIILFHAGTKLDREGRAVTNGGRVLVVSATGQNIGVARQIVYDNLPRISFEGCHYRKDIAKIYDL